MAEPSFFGMTTMPSLGGNSGPSMGGAIPRGMSTRDRLRSKKSGSTQPPAPAPATGVPAATGNFHGAQDTAQRLALIQAMAQRARGRPVTNPGV
jgi:hypothetical protein